MSRVSPAAACLGLATPTTTPLATKPLPQHNDFGGRPVGRFQNFQKHKSLFINTLQKIRGP